MVMALENKNKYQVLSFYIAARLFIIPHAYIYIYIIYIYVYIVYSIL